MKKILIVCACSFILFATPNGVSGQAQVTKDFLSQVKAILAEAEKGNLKSYMGTEVKSNSTVSKSYQSKLPITNFQVNVIAIYDGKYTVQATLPRTDDDSDIKLKNILSQLSQLQGYDIKDSKTSKDEDYFKDYDELADDVSRIIEYHKNGVRKIRVDLNEDQTIDLTFYQ